jgi:hypothetical protein
MFTPQLPGIELMAAMERERRRDLLREAERWRLVRKAKSTRHDFLDRVLTGIGDVLISAGEKLQGRYPPAIGRLQLP